MSKLQSALAEQSTPLLVHASLWNSFIERRLSFEQNAQRYEEYYISLKNRKQDEHHRKGG